MDRITLVCTSLGKRPELLRRMLDTAIGFDDTWLHYDRDCIVQIDGGLENQDIPFPEHLTIPEAYNHLIGKEVSTEWICCFCDDDHFYSDALSKMIDEIHKGIDADVAHFKFHISGYAPPQDVRCWFGRKEYDLCEKKPITPRLLEKHNRLPAGSFFRKSAWEKIGGFQGDKFHDWDLWKRMAQAGLKFKYFDYLVYNHVRRENSAWIKQNT